MVDSRAGEKCKMNLEYLVVLERKKMLKECWGHGKDAETSLRSAQGPNLEQVKDQNDYESYGLWPTEWNSNSWVCIDVHKWINK